MSFLAAAMLPHPLFDEEQCHTDDDAYLLAVSIFLAVGMLVSYLPQHYRIIANKTSEGFSPYFLLLGVISSTSSVLNIIILSWPAIVCCRHVGAGPCTMNLMGVIQIGIQFVMFTLVFILFLIYFPAQLKLEPYIPAIHHGTPPTNTSWEWRLSLIVATTCLVHFIICVAISGYLLAFADHPITLVWAGFLGISSMILASFQYLPQILYTWRSKRVGALSIPMMLVQTPGAFLLVITLAARETTNWTTWITFFVAGCLQGTLLILCLVFHFHAKRLGLDDLSGVKIIVVSEGQPGSGMGVRRGTKRGGSRKSQTTAITNAEENENNEAATERTGLLSGERSTNAGGEGGSQPTR